MYDSSIARNNWKKRETKLIALIVLSLCMIVYAFFQAAYLFQSPGKYKQDVVHHLTSIETPGQMHPPIVLAASLFLLVSVFISLFKEIRLRLKEQTETHHLDLPKHSVKHDDIADTPSGADTALLKQDGMAYTGFEQKKLADTILAVQEQERRYIGQELHDNVNQILAGAMITLDTVKDLGADTDKALKFTNTAKSYIHQAINEIRRLSHELSPATFDDDGNENIFENLLQGININGRYIIKTQVDSKLKQLVPDEVFTNLYRILQEQVKNIVAYADARQIELSINCTGKHVEMRISDNGKGFDARQKKNGIGISNMRRRAANLGGNLFINTQPGKGCELIVDIPLS